MKFNLKYLVLPLGIMVCTSEHYSNASENNNNGEMQRILAARNAYFARYNNFNNSNNESNNENEINLNEQEQHHSQNSNTINNDDIISRRNDYFTNHNFNGYNNNMNNNNVINTEPNRRNEQEQEQLKQRVLELISNITDDQNFYDSLTVGETNEFKESFGLDINKISYINAEKRRILEKFERKFTEHRSKAFFNTLTKNTNNISKSDVNIRNAKNNYDMNTLSNKEFKERMSNAAKIMNDTMLNCNNKQIEDKFNKIIELQEELENNIKYIVTQDDINVLKSIEQDMNQPIINSRNTKQLLNNDNANNDNNSTDSSNKSIKENLDENYEKNSYDDIYEVDPELRYRIKNAISFLTIKQKLLFNGDKTKSEYKEIDKKINEFEKLLLNNMSNMNENDLSAIEKEMSTIDRNHVTQEQLYEAYNLLMYKADNFDNNYLFEKANEFSTLSPNKMTNVQYYYLVNLLNENNKNKKSNTTNNTIYNFNENIQQDDELQQYADETNNEIEDLRKKAQQCADNDDYDMMEYYNNQADELEKNK